MKASTNGPSAEAAGLSWTLKSSFVEYIGRMSDGRCSTTDGASISSGSTFFFEHHHTDAHTIGFRGDVRFAGHHGMLFVCIADPVIDLGGSRAVITVQQPETGLLPAERITLATAEISLVATTANGTLYSASDVQLTLSGSEIFGGVYKPGDPLDDFTFVIPSALHDPAEGIPA